MDLTDLAQGRSAQTDGCDLGSLRVEQDDEPRDDAECAGDEGGAEQEEQAELMLACFVGCGGLQPSVDWLVVSACLAGDRGQCGK